MVFVYVINFCITSIFNILIKNPITYGLLSVSLIAFASWFISWRNSRKHLYELAAKVPFPKNVTYYPIIGHAHLFMGGTSRIYQSIKTILNSDSDDVMTVWLGHRIFFVVTRPEHMEIVLNSPNTMAKDDLYRMAWTVAGHGLFAAPIEKWKRNRKIINPAFNQKIIDGHVHIFSEKSEILCEVLSKYDGKGVFDIYKTICNYNVDIICETAMGIKTNHQTGDSALAHLMSAGLWILMNRMFNVLLHSDFIFSLTNLHKTEQKILAGIDEFVHKVIDQKKKEFEEREKQKTFQIEAEIEELSLGRKAFLELLIERSTNEQTLLTDKQLRDEVTTFLIAGSDTSAVTMSFICLMLGMFPECQQKLYEEVIEVIGHDRPVEKDDILKFVYMDKFIKETMRIFPIGPTIVRKADGDIDLGDCVVPKGAGLVLAILGTHYSKSIFKNPYKFDPERFSPDEVAKRHPYSFLPFSGGPRNCIGWKSAMTSMKTAIANIVRKFVLSTPFQKIEDIDVRQELIISSGNGYPVSITRRQ